MLVDNVVNLSHSTISFDIEVDADDLAPTKRV